MWVLQKSGEIDLMEKLHPLNQNKFANIMHRSPTIFPPEEFQLNSADLYNYLENFKKLEKEEQRRLQAEAKRKLFASQRKLSPFGFKTNGRTVFADQVDAGSRREQTPQQVSSRENDGKSERPKSRGGTPGASVRKRRGKKLKKPATGTTTGTETAVTTTEQTSELGAKEDKAPIPSSDTK